MVKPKLGLPQLQCIMGSREWWEFPPFSKDHWQCPCTALTAKPSRLCKETVKESSHQVMPKPWRKRKLFLYSTSLTINQDLLNRTCHPGGHNLNYYPVTRSPESSHCDSFEDRAPQVPDLQMSCSDLTVWEGTRIVVPAMAASWYTPSILNIIWYWPHAYTEMATLSQVQMLGCCFTTKILSYQNRRSHCGDTPQWDFLYW